MPTEITQRIASPGSPFLPTLMNTSRIAWRFSSTVFAFDANNSACSAIACAIAPAWLPAAGSSSREWTRTVRRIAFGTPVVGSTLEKRSRWPGFQIEPSLYPGNVTV